MILYFHKRDLRLFDNEALHRAVSLSMQENIPLLPLMGLEKDLIENKDTAYEFSEFQQYGSLSAILPLFHNYMYYGVSPLLFHESVISVLQKIYKKEKIHYLISHEEAGTYGTYTRDKRIKKFCLENSIVYIELPHNGIVRKLQSRDVWGKQVKEYVSARTLPIPPLRTVKGVSLQKEFDVDKVLTTLQT